MQSALSELIEREVTRIQDELRLYADEGLVWKTVDGISNSGGNLALHVAGNLQHFIGATLGHTGYVRQRDLEFSSKHVALNEVISELEKAKLAVSSTLAALSSEDMQQHFPINVFGKEMTTEWFLLHLLSHTSYHLGQINYHRRLV